METQEILVYLFIIGTFIAAWWMFVSIGDGDRAYDDGRGAGWSRLPLVFRATWGFVTFFENSLGELLSELMPKRAQRIEELAVVASLPLSANRVLAASLALGLVGALLGAIAVAVIYVTVPSAWVGVGLAFCLALFAMGWFWPGQSLLHHARMRQQQLTRELPFAIDLIGGAMQSGLDFGAAMRYYIGLGTGGPLEEEFRHVLTDIGVSTPMDRALNDMANRVKIESFTSFASVVAYGMEIGAPIAKTLKAHGGDLRRVRFNLAERKAARVPALMIIPLVLFIMPAVFIVLLTPMVMRLVRLF